MYVVYFLCLHNQCLIAQYRHDSNYGFVFCCAVQKWRLVFDQFDPEGFGEIPVEQFLLALQSPAFQAHIPINKRELLYERAQKAKEPRGAGFVSFQEFVNVVSCI